MHGATVTPGLLLDDRYELSRLLGRGGMGQVWEGKDLRLKRPVAVKILSPAGVLEPRDLALFRREAEIGAMLSHPGITTVFDLGSPSRDGGTPWYLVMERLVGHSLDREVRLHRDGLPWERVVDLGRQVADALAAAHTQGVVHRDIKPANLFLQQSGVVKICDFGISRLANATSLLTGVVQAAGTLPYMAPEQFATLAVDHRSDLYALGCVLHELLVGAPWVDPRADWPGAMYRHHQVAPPSSAAARPDIPEALDRLVLDLLAKDPADRPSDASTVTARLRDIARQPGQGHGADHRRGPGLDARTRRLTEAATAFRALHARRATETVTVLRTSQAMHPPTGPSQVSTPRRTSVEQLVAGRFRLLQKLGSGGYGEVWSAYDERLRVEVALKQVRVDPSAGNTERDAVLGQAEDEARHAARLRDHPNIVTVFDVVGDGGTPWLVMRLVEGRTLDQEIRERGPLGPVMAAHVAAGVLAALDAAHESGVLHRDVKPANIMLAEDGTVLLTDFGIAKGSTTTTQAVLAGTLPYMSPERLNGRDTPAGDLFALGASLYEATEGVSPFARATPTATMAAVALEEPPPPAKAGRLRGLITALLDKDPERRPSAASALVLLANAEGPHRTPRQERTPGRSVDVAARQATPVRTDDIAPQQRTPVLTGDVTASAAPAKSRIGEALEVAVFLAKACFWIFGILGVLIGLCSNPAAFDASAPSWFPIPLPHGTRVSNAFSGLVLVGGTAAVVTALLTFFWGLLSTDPKS
ncbi:serine/threonine-protein kinase [Streptomyces mangrovisoli]|uniref:non-specific serine/threonine protein kinase n=1 Tax=Streptomyces mangrovisoli TaxID=1428628 RepID=A0A1J4NN06_9ACTN|nr:serine/threonine-protein kinase [Streptomyces mangrovisoli]OIJ63672.1 hypothetical protein WN71_033195 [Streptomyces mangrovisoli]